MEIVQLENRYDQKGQEDLFCLTGFFRGREQFQGKKIWLYGFNKKTKRFLFYLNFQSTVTGFLCAEGEQVPCGMEYFGKPVLTREEFLERNAKDTTVLDIYGDCLSEIWDRFHLRGETLVTPPAEVEPFLIYGTGSGGHELGDFFLRCGITNFFYCARSDKRRDWMSPDCKVITPDKLDAVDKSLPVIITIWSEKEVDGIKAMLKGKGFLKVFCLDPYFFEAGSYLAARRSDGSNRIVFSLAGLFWLRHMVHLKKQVFFFTNDVPYGLRVLSALNALGIPAASFFTERACDDPRARSAYELLDMDLSDSLVWALSGDREAALAFCQSSGFPIARFFCGKIPKPIDWILILDTNLGYDDNRGLLLLRNCDLEEPVLRVAILGNSAASHEYYGLPSWPDCLLEVAKTAGIRMECLMAATGGYKSPQELIRLCRDIVRKKPDVVISYSGINEWMQGVERYPFAHNYQKELFEAVLQDPEKPPIPLVRHSGRLFSMGEPEENLSSVWLDNERMMHAICQEFGIVFFGILQPYAHPQSPVHAQLFEELFVDKEQGLNDFSKKQQQPMEYIRSKLADYPWLYDFTEFFEDGPAEAFFDTCHVYEDGNRRIAERILSIIQKTTGELQ